MIARKFYETLDHAVVGPMPLPTVPFRFASVDRWLRSPAPLLGQHNGDILQGLIGLSDTDVVQLEREGVIGTRPKGV